MSGLADSPLFAPFPPVVKVEPVAPLSPEIPIEKEQDKSAQKKKDDATKQPRHHDTVIPRNLDTMVSSNHDTTVSRIQDTTIETVRKAVKEFGKEAATHRFTLDEKKAILNIVYSYQNIGIKTSENEVVRIAINFIVDDYKQYGHSSILDKVLKALNK